MREELLLFEPVDRDDPLFADFRDDPPRFDEPLVFDVRDDPLLFEEPLLFDDPPLFDEPPLLAVFDRDELPLLAELLDPLFEDDELLRDELFFDPDFDDEVGDPLTAERPPRRVSVPAADAAAPSTAPTAAPLSASLIRSFALSYIVWIVPFCFAIICQRSFSQNSKTTARYNNACKQVCLIAYIK